MAKQATVERVLYTIPETAQAMGVSTRFVWSLVYSGKLPVKRVEGRVLVPRQQLEAWAASVDEVR